MQKNIRLTTGRNTPKGIACDSSRNKVVKTPIAQTTNNNSSKPIFVLSGVVHMDVGGLDIEYE
jgi:hypothetical protein